MDVPKGLILGEPFLSRYVQPRQVDIWLPPQYATEPQARFPVLYMHDGQNLFVPELSYRGVDWGVDEALNRLAASGELRRAPLVVGIWNTSLRVNEYLPCRPLGEDFSEQQRPDPKPTRRGCGSPEVLERFARRLKGPVLSDEYLRFIVEELKPWVDAHYRTLPGREDTAIMGSSMGGLISLYALCEYPQVFGGAGCVSTHWPLGGNRYLPYLRARLPLPGDHRIYFDHGTEELDGLYAGYQRRVDTVMEEVGYRSQVDWITRVYAGTGHSEVAWRARLDIPLRFLFAA